MTAETRTRLLDAVNDVALMVFDGRAGELPPGERGNSCQCPVATKLTEIMGVQVVVGRKTAGIGRAIVALPKNLQDWIERFDYGWD